jgi:DNA-binding CsgD family transcriptional regulator
VADNSTLTAERGSASLVRMPLGEFSELVRLIFLGPTEAVPWQSALEAIGRQLRANWVTLMLRPPAPERSGLVLVSQPGHPVRVGTTYNQYAYALDPFVHLPLDRVLRIDDVIEVREWHNTAFYKEFLVPSNIGHMAGVDFRTCDGMDCHFRVCRPARGAADAAAGNFSRQDCALIDMLLPHLKLSVHLHSALDVIETERKFYAGAVDRMMVGTVILDETGAIMKTNSVADETLAHNDGIRLMHGGLKAHYQQEDRELQRLVKVALTAATRWKPIMAEAVALSRPSGRAKLGIVVRAMPLNTWSEGKHRPSVAVFLRDPERKSMASQEIVQDLFDLTPAEAALTMLLANGLTLEEAAEHLSIRKNTVRAHLRSIFSKTGVTRQTMLVRLVLGSIALG